MTPAYLLRAAVLYVDAAATGANNGSSWTDAYNYLQDALTAAGSGSEIWAAQGTYRPDANTAHSGGTNNRDATFQLENGVAIYGGFPTGGGSRDPNTYTTILSGDINVPNDGSDNSYHVVTGSGTDSTAVLDGFTITKGYAYTKEMGVNYSGGGMYNDSGSPTLANCIFTGNSAGGNYGSACGGGMYNSNSSPTLTNCTFSGNSAEDYEAYCYGGGMYNVSSSPTLTNCTFSGNEAGGFDNSCGGGIYNEDGNPILTNCTFSGNETQGWSYAFGGGIYNASGSLTLTNCTFSGNQADSWNSAYGGGIYNASGSPTLTNCTFNNNSAYSPSCSGYGGGILNVSGSPTLTNCIFSGNQAVSGMHDGGYGGGIFNTGSNLDITNCIFSGNQASGGAPDGSHGGGIFNTGSSNISNCTLTGNSAVGDYGSSSGGGIYSSGSPIITDCILWANSAPIGPQIYGSPTVTFSDVQGGWTGTGNINADPCFVTGPDGNYYLSQITAGQAVDSPCVDAGSDTAANLEMDLFTTRTDQLPDIGTVDMGYHYTSTMSADIDKNWHVDFLDFAILAADWLQCSNPYDSNCTETGLLAGDIIPDYYVNIYDLAILTDCWLDCYVKKATDPQPPDGQDNMDPDNTVLEWSVGDGAIYHDVYLGTDADAVANAGHLSEEFKDTVSETSFNPGILDANTTYYWRIDEIGPACAAKGDTWRFTTTISRCIYVDAAATGSNNGSTWIDAYNYLQDAFAAAGSGSEIWVAQGTYKPDANSLYPSGTNNRTATFKLKNNVAIYGGFPTGGGTRDPNTYVTILSGDINVPDNNSDNSYHVVTGSGTDSTAVLDGFTITKGYANGSSADNAGGGMFNAAAGSPTITNCILTGNSAFHGAGMYNGSSSPTLTNCTFSGNLVTGGSDYSNVGGGMFNYYSSPTLTNCTFTGNHASGGSYSGNGGGIYNTHGSPILTNCSFTDNLATGGACLGGGMCSVAGSSPTLTNCIFTGNSAGYGGGIYNNSGFTLNNCTFSGNSSGNGGGINNSGGNLTVTDSILWGNTASAGPQIRNSSGTVTVSFSDVQDGWAGTGNINADPCFVAGPSGNYYLSQIASGQTFDSPCVDAGSDTSANLGMDVFTTRTDGVCDTGIVDMGYHYPP